MTATPPIESILDEARGLGFLGPGAIDGHLRHAAALAEIARPDDVHWLDLGSGAGVPGLVWLASRSTGPAVLVDANARRCAFLTDALGRLRLADRARVVCGRAEVLARDPELREAFGLVVARSFGRPATTAECSAGFLEGGGRLVVSEPPASDEHWSATAAGQVRWPAEGLAVLGFGPATIVRGEGVSAAITERRDPLDDRWPRRDGIPAKRPLW